jgi:hypothetical protein
MGKGGRPSVQHGGTVTTLDWLTEATRWPVRTEAAVVRRPSEERAQVYAFGWNAQRATAAPRAAAAILSNPSSTRRGCSLKLPSRSRLWRRKRNYAAFFTAVSTSSSAGSNSPFWATTLPFTDTVNSPWSPLTTCTSTPGSFLNDAARLAACARTEPQTGHCRITTFFIAVAPFQTH